MKNSPTRKLFNFISKTLLYKNNSSKIKFGSNNSLAMVKTAKNFTEEKLSKSTPLALKLLQGVITVYRAGVYGGSVGLGRGAGRPYGVSRGQL